MIKAEIKTDAGIYYVQFNKLDDPMEAFTAIEDRLQGYMPFEGDDELLVIAAGAKLKHIRIWDPAKNPDQVGEMVPDQRPGGEPPVNKEGIFDWETTATYLGKTFTLSGVGYREGSNAVYMPVTIDGDPASVHLSNDKLSEILVMWRESHGDSPGTYGLYHLPDSLIIEATDAGSFLLEALTSKDYVAKDKNGFAFNEWRGLS